MNPQPGEYSKDRDWLVMGPLKVGDPMPPHDAVNHPKHYTSHPAGIECIQVTEHMNFNLGNVVKYVWRFDDKGGVQDLKKAAWYLQREIERLERDNETSA